MIASITPVPLAEAALRMPEEGVPVLHSYSVCPSWIHTSLASAAE